MILAFSIFPLLVSALSGGLRFQLAAGGYRLRYIGWLNFRKLLFGGEQFHFLGVFAPVPWYGWLLLAAGAWFLLRRLVAYLRDGRITAAGLLGRLIGAALLLAIFLLFAATLGPGGQFGSLGVTVLYVAIGVAAQFGIGLGLALLCAQQIAARGFFRVVFFIPLMVTPVGSPIPSACWRI